jgi:hypothetical protein
MSQPDQQSRTQFFVWIGLGAMLFTALIEMAHFAQAYPHRSLIWLCMALPVGTSLLFFVKAVRTPSEINNQTSMISSAIAALYFTVPFLHLLSR